MGLSYASVMGGIPFLELGKRRHKVVKEHAQGQAVNQWESQDPAELSSATTVTPGQAPSAQQDNYYLVTDIREFS